MQRMKETDVKDKRGNIVIAPGLKVRHKESQYEYTVDSVVKEPSGQITIMLKAPESPRFDANKKEPTRKQRHRARSHRRDDFAMLTDRAPASVLYEAEPIDDLGSMFYVPEDETESDEDLLAVPAAEFEKEYEVR